MKRLRCRGVALAVLLSALSSSIGAQGVREQRIERLVVTSPAVLDDGAFSILNTLDTIARSTGQPALETEEARVARAAALMKTMLETLDDSTFELSSGVEVPQPVRPEAKLDARSLVTPGSDLELLPLALFNRMDLMPASATHCGEHRIVYGIKRASPSTSNPRFFIIFEPVIPSPEMRNPLACLPLAHAWQRVGEEFDPAIQLSLLKEIYFEGVRQGATAFEPAIDARHFGEPFGQVRSNMFFVKAVNEAPWQLREWRVSSTSGVEFVAHRVKDSAHGAFWSDLVPTDNLAGEQKSFLSAFVATAGFGAFLHELAPTGLLPPCGGVLTDFTANIPDRFLGGKSDAAEQGSPLSAQSRPKLVADAVTKSVNAAAQPAQALTVSHALTRLDALTCGGCHNTSAGKEIAPGVEWPSSIGFVHVSEERQLSDALTKVFLPARSCAMDKLVGKLAGRSADSAFINSSTMDALTLERPLSETALAFQRVRDERLRRDQSKALRGMQMDAPVPMSTDEALEALIERARQLEEAESGAVVPRRRTHG